jgi:hypothetical protein
MRLRSARRSRLPGRGCLATGAVPSRPAGMTAVHALMAVLLGWRRAEQADRAVRAAEQADADDHESSDQEHAADGAGYSQESAALAGGIGENRLGADHLGLGLRLAGSTRARLVLVHEGRVYGSSRRNADKGREACG